MSSSRQRRDYLGWRRKASLQSDIVLAPYFGGDFAFAWTPHQLIAIADSHGPGPTPGALQEYSNSNYTLLGLVVEAVTDQTLAQAFQDRLFGPLGLAHSTFAVDASPDASRARGYLLSDDEPLDVTDLFPFYWGAGTSFLTLPTSPDSMTRLLNCQLVTPMLLAAMKSPVAGTLNDYGFDSFVHPRHAAMGSGTMVRRRAIRRLPWDSEADASS